MLVKLLIPLILLLGSSPGAASVVGAAAETAAAAVIERAVRAFGDSLTLELARRLAAAPDIESRRVGALVALLRTALEVHGEELAAELLAGRFDAGGDRRIAALAHALDELLDDVELDASNLLTAVLRILRPTASPAPSDPPADVEPLSGGAVAQPAKHVCCGCGGRYSPPCPMAHNCLCRVTGVTSCDA